MDARELPQTAALTRLEPPAGLNWTLARPEPVAAEPAPPSEEL